MQNRGHISHLDKFLHETTPIHSIIVFSNDCTFMDVKINSNDVTMINRSRLNDAIENIYAITDGFFLNEGQINEIYNKLYPYTQVSDDIKAQHIENIKRNSTR